MRPARWNSLITLETASRVETIMFARSWCVRRTFRTVPDAVGLPETVAQVREQRGQPRRDLPVQEAFDHLVGLPETLGEGGEQLRGELRVALYDLVEGGLPHPTTRTSVIASAKAFWRGVSSRLSSPKTSPSFNSATVASLYSP